MRYVLVMLGSLVGLVIVAYLLLYLLISVGCIYPANYAEQKINEAYDTILRADKVTAEMIPALCDYVIFSENGEKIGGDLSEQYEQIAWNVAKYGNASGKYFYKVIVRENEYVVLQYRLTPQYHSAFLREHFIGPQNVMIIMSVIGAVAIIIIPSIRFGKRIKKQMQPVLDAIGQIKDQNLEYETSCSGIKEFDDCLSAIDDMRDALRESLEKQWKTEQEKKQQMSALAHDIKTPLTIVRGNAELLSETELTTEQKNNITYVLNGTTQIQSYVKQLIDVTKSWNCSDVTYTTVRLEDFFADTIKTNASAKSQDETSASDADLTPTPTMAPVSLTVSVVGDCTLGTDENFDYDTSLNAYYENYGADYFFSNVKSIFSADDLTIANFEGTLTDSEDREDKEYAFKAPAEYAGILTSGSVEAVNTANNHSHDYGNQGYEDTISALDSAGILNFGYDKTLVTEVKGIKVGLVGIYELKDHLERKEQLKQNIAKVKAEGAVIWILLGITKISYFTNP